MPATLALVESAYAAAEAPARWPEFLERLAPLVPAPALLLVLRSPSAGDPGIVYANGAAPGFVREYSERLWARDPWRERAARLPEGTIALGHSLLADEELERTDFYREWLAPQNVHYPFAAILARRDGACANLCGLRPKSAGPFALDELAVVRTLVPHLQRALGLAHALAAAHAVRDGLLEAIEGGVSGWILLGERAQVLAADAAGEALLGRGDVLRRDGDRLAATDGTLDAHLHDLVQKATSGGPGGSLKLGGSGRPLRVRVAPAGGGARAAEAGRPSALVLLADPELLAGARDERLRREFSLTPAECRVAGLLADGNRLSDIAASIGISINTVRGHLKQVFAKTGTHRQAELVRLVLGAPPGS